MKYWLMILILFVSCNPKYARIDYPDRTEYGQIELVSITDDSVHVRFYPFKPDSSKALFVWDGHDEPVTYVFHLFEDLGVRPERIINGVTWPAVHPYRHILAEAVNTPRFECEIDSIPDRAGCYVMAIDSVGNWSCCEMVHFNFGKTLSKAVNIRTVSPVDTLDIHYKTRGK